MGGIQLTLCMIVKNEEDCIARCLESIKGAVDEMIIVDTGSTDRTIEICQSYGAKIEKFKWNGSFADARNYSISKATGDWIIWLDADEELDPDGPQKLRGGAHFENFDAINIHLINYYGDRLDKNNSTDIAHTRLFRNKGIKFVNKMHECLDLENIPKHRIGYLDIKLHHYGYLNTIVKRKGKSKRNIQMLEQQIREGENVYWAHYYIALEHYNKKEYFKALERVNQSILAFLQNNSLPSSMAYKLKYSILIAMGKFQEALAGIEKALILYPDYVDLHFFKGLILYNLKKYEEAIKAFTGCINLGEVNPDYLILKGVGSFQAWYYIGLCEQKLKQEERAVVSLLNALLLSQEYKEAMDLLRKLLKRRTDWGLKVAEDHFNGKQLEDIQKIIRNF